MMQVFLKEAQVRCSSCGWTWATHPETVNKHYKLRIAMRMHYQNTEHREYKFEEVYVIEKSLRWRR